MELARFTSRGGFSVRRIITFVVAALLAAILWVAATSVPTYAVEPASWQDNGTILYDGRAYRPADPNIDKSHGIADGTTLYIHIDNVDQGQRKAHFLYFVSGTDPPTATEAQYINFDYSSDRKFSNPAGQTTVAITPQSTTSCDVDGGVGWMICPISNFLADTMDNLFNIIAQFVEVQPLILTNGQSDLHTAWNVMRNIANVAFVIAFLIIIYSQLTGAGVSNYGLKKLIPRLIIAAIMVNVSFYIAAIAIDLSNVIAYSIQDIFTAIRHDIFHIDNSTFGEGTNQWAAVTGVILAGGGLIGGAYAISGGALYMLVPLLIGLLLTALLVLIILAARQAIIIILVVIAPIAFVANLLPNTEKWFKSWQNLFMTMLIFFPAFAAVFGGAQLAGQVIIQNAQRDDGLDLVIMLFGMAVQIAPLVITPMLLKLSGSLLGKIAGIVNDPRKGFIDRSRSWAKDRTELARQRRLNQAGPLGAMARFGDFGNRRVKDKTEEAKTRADNRYRRTPKYRNIYASNEEANLRKEQVDNELKTHTQNRMARDGSKLNYAMADLESSKTGLEQASTRVEGIKAEMQSGGYVTKDRRLQRVQSQIARNVIGTTALKRRVESANMRLQETYALALKDSEATANIFMDGKSLIDIAGGIDRNGAQRAIASAGTIISKLREEAIDNMKKIIESRNLSDKEIVDLALGTEQKGIKVTTDSMAAALQMSLGGGNTEQVERAMEELDFSFAHVLSPEDQDTLRITAAKALAGNSSRPTFMGMGAIGMMKEGKDFQGKLFSGKYGRAGMEEMAFASMKGGKMDVSKLQSLGKDYAEVLDSVFAKKGATLPADIKKQLIIDLAATLDPRRPEFKALGDSRGPLRALYRKLGKDPDNIINEFPLT